MFFVSMNMDVFACSPIAGIELESFIELYQPPFLSKGFWNYTLKRFSKYIIYSKSLNSRNESYRSSCIREDYLID